MRVSTIALLIAVAVSGLPALAATSLGEFIYLSRMELSPENSEVRFGSGENLYGGRIHTNGRIVLSPFGWPVLGGLATQGADAPANLGPDQYHIVFQGNWAFPYPRVVWPPEEALEAIRHACDPAHVWPAEEQGLALTTLLRFDHELVRVAQYYPTLTAPGDTAFHLSWTIQPLPQLPAAEPLIWVQGVARLKGVVEGELTVLVSDSLFLMGDLIVADAILAPCGDEQLFGTVPADSPQRIGLIGEKDVIIAATLENGFANGEVTPQVSCGLLNDDPVISSCNQARRDVVITAAILATGCSFETEFWKTTAWGALVPVPSPQPADCGGVNNEQIEIWPSGSCPGAAQESDRRGNLWLHGALAHASRGFLARSSPGPWGQVNIGYANRVWRHDSRLRSNPPPWWPELDWEWTLDPDGNGDVVVPAPPPSIELLASPGSACGAVQDSAFIAAAAAGQVGLRIVWTDFERLPVWIRLRSEARTLLDTLLVLDEVPQWEWRPWAEGSGIFDPAQFLAFEEPFWLEVRGDWFEWNLGGEACRWHFDPEADVEPSVAARPAKLALGLPYPNPFNPTTRVSLRLPAPEGVRLALVDLLGREARVLHEGLLPAGNHELAVDAAGLPSGLWLLRLERAGGAVEARKLLLMR
jgi:hypothetical protein